MYDLPAFYELLTQSQRRDVRNQYRKEQNDLCYYCKKPLSGEPSKRVLTARINKALFPDCFFKHPVHLQHCHETGLTEGAVHSRCNAYMWQYLGR